MEWLVRSFGDLSTSELYELLRLRADIFVVEQECAYADPDGKDQKALHLLGYEGEELVACARIFGPGDYMEQVSIGRVAVNKEHRGRALGKQLMLRAMEAVRERWGAVPVALSAQTYLRKFYSELGFSETGTEYLEDGIPHIKMIRS